jgi:SNF2 family DNA or RNA helicase
MDTDIDVLRHVKANTLRTCRFHGKNRPTSLTDLNGFDIVLTTYATLSAEHKNRGVLHQADWYRVVLDEGKTYFHS